MALSSSVARNAGQAQLAEVIEHVVTCSDFGLGTLVSIMSSSASVRQSLKVATASAHFDINVDRQDHFNWVQLWPNLIGSLRVDSPSFDVERIRAVVAIERLTRLEGLSLPSAEQVQSVLEVVPAGLQALQFQVFDGSIPDLPTLPALRGLRSLEVMSVVDPVFVSHLQRYTPALEQLSINLGGIQVDGLQLTGLQSLTKLTLCGGSDHHWDDRLVLDDSCMFPVSLHELSVDKGVFQYMSTVTTLVNLTRLAFNASLIAPAELRTLIALPELQCLSLTYSNYIEDSGLIDREENALSAQPAWLQYWEAAHPLRERLSGLGEAEYETMLNREMPALEQHLAAVKFPLGSVWASLPCLTELRFCECDFPSTLFTETLACASSIIALELMGQVVINPFDGDDGGPSRVPTLLARLPALRSLTISDGICEYSGEVLEALRFVSHIETLTLIQCELEEDDVDWLIPASNHLKSRTFVRCMGGEKVETRLRSLRNIEIVGWETIHMGESESEED